MRFSCDEIFSIIHVCVLCIEREKKPEEKFKIKTF